jgi:hypothetical protein
VPLSSPDDLQRLRSSTSSTAGFKKYLGTLHAPAVAITQRHIPNALSMSKVALSKLSDAQIIDAFKILVLKRVLRCRHNSLEDILVCSGNGVLYPCSWGVATGPLKATLHSVSDNPKRRKEFQQRLIAAAWVGYDPLQEYLEGIRDAAEQARYAECDYGWMWLLENTPWLPLTQRLFL